MILSTTQHPQLVLTICSVYYVVGVLVATLLEIHLQLMLMHFRFSLFNPPHCKKFLWRQILNCSEPWGGSVHGSWERGHHFGGRGPRAPRRG